MFLCFWECSIVYQHFTDTTLPNILRFFPVNISDHFMKECQITSIFLAKENTKWIPQLVIYVLSIKLFKTRIIWIYFITICQSCIAKYSLEIWLFYCKCVCLWSYIHRTSVQKKCVCLWAYIHRTLPVRKGTTQGVKIWAKKSINI